MIGTGLVVIMPFLDGLNGIRVSGALSAQDMGILAGFVVLLSGLLLYLGSIISYMEHRYRELELKVEGLSAASGEMPRAAPGKAIQKKTITASPPDAPDEIPAPAADDATEAREPMAAPPPEANGTAAHAPPAEPAAVTPAPPPAERPAYDYGTSPAPGAAACRVCGNELSAGVCRYCITSASVQSAYQELSRTQELGASVEDATVLLENAQRSLEEKEYLEAGDLLRSSRHFLEISAKTYFALRGAVEKAEAERKKLEDSGLDTTELSSKLSDIRSATLKGSYHEAKALIDEERRAADDLRLPYFQRPAKTIVRKPLTAPAIEPSDAKPKAPTAPAAVPRFVSGISGCPKCGRRTMKGWKKCPHCLTSLQ